MQGNTTVTEPDEMRFQTVCFQMDLLSLNRQLATLDVRQSATVGEKMDIQSHELALAAMRTMAGRG